MLLWFKSTSSQHVEFGGRVGIRKGSGEIAALACAGWVKATIFLKMVAEPTTQPPNFTRVGTLNWKFWSHLRADGTSPKSEAGPGLNKLKDQHDIPEGPRIEKFQSREAILKKTSFRYRMKFSIENGFFMPGPSLAAEKQGRIEIFNRK